MMTEEKEQASASLTRAYARLLGNELLPSRSGDLEGSDYPLLAESRMPINASRVQTYRQNCRLPEESVLPPLYPQIAAMPLHLQLLSTPGLPGRSLGVVHVGQRVWFHQAMELPGKAMKLETALRPGQAHSRGQIFHMDTRWRDEAGALVWEGESLFLFRGVTAESEASQMSRVPKSGLELPGNALEKPFECPTGIGRSYARTSGDWNPIHLSSMSARLFGFPCPIVHGMWALARALGVLQEESRQTFTGQALEAWFNAPLFWPSTTRIHLSPKGDWFQVDREGKRQRPALWGQFFPLNELKRGPEEE